MAATNGTPAAALMNVKVPVGMGRTLDGRLHCTGSASPRGIVLALHGGGYTAKYFDTPGQSALACIAQCGFHVLAVDRPGYGRNAAWALPFDAQVPVLLESLSWLQREVGNTGSPAFLYGHSIGGMLSLLMANAAPALVLGVSMTGSGAQYHANAFAALSARLQDPATGSHSMAGESARRALFMGPEGGFDPAVARLDPERDAPSTVVELRDALRWHERLPQEGPRAQVPVQFVVPEFDGLWRSDAEALAGMPTLFSQAPFTDIHVQRRAGHTVELQHLWRAHVCKVLAFAEECRHWHLHGIRSCPQPSH